MMKFCYCFSAKIATFWAINVQVFKTQLEYFCAQLLLSVTNVLHCCSSWAQKYSSWVLNSYTALYSNCFKQLSLALQFASISSPAGVSLKTSNQDHSEKMSRTTPDSAV